MRRRALMAILSVGSAVGSVGGLGCDPPADASVLLDLEAFANNGVPDLRAPVATLEVKDGDGEALAVEVRNDLDDPILVQSPLPVPCDDDGICSVSLRVKPGTVTFDLLLTAEDRCATRAELMRFSSGAVQLEPYVGETVVLDLVDASFDDDADGIANVLEQAVCGRVDRADAAVPPLVCADPDDACCAGISELEGRMTAFPGGAHTLAAGDVVDVTPFALDATEVTWRVFARCVAAGACLAGQPGHPVRAALATGVDPATPVVGLLPVEAAELCAFAGKRLPLDVEWDFAASHRPGELDPAARGRFPWSGDPQAPGGPGAADDDVDCQPGLTALSANHAISGKACPGVPLPVGSFPSTWVHRGAGVPLADMGGNVAEWTLVTSASAPSIPELPEGTSEAVLRGGGARSPLALLENDLPVVARLPANGDVDAWRASVTRLASSAGVRCAVDVEDGLVAPAEPEEPACR